jgi:S-adenosylmethionine hydrolase
MPIVTLTTDFGEADHFVAVMKGVILSRAPRATLVDVTHEIAAHDVGEAAFVVGETYRYYPKGTIHVVVVDPGVGTERRALLVEAAGQYFVGPDNGVLARVYRKEKAKVRALTNKKYFLKEVSQTFHGRDVFAPVAGHLAAGVKPAAMGKLINDYLRPAGLEAVRTGKRFWAGAVIKVDRFGNLITNLSPAEIPDLLSRPFTLVVGVTPVERLVRAYAEGGAGEAVAIVGSSGYLEVIVNQGNAAKQLGCVAGSPVELTLY